MKAKIIITLSFIAAIAIMTGCTKQPYYDIPYDENGNVYITKISIITSTGVTTADDSFTINCYFPNAKSGDVIRLLFYNSRYPVGIQLVPNNFCR
ncbi:MAG TPA: hypothetical protein PLO24_05080 [Bacteroidales bacterium]|nr:hypothetical protein [Bacteroidales bacterium]